jgi:hypothetical protein
MYLQPSGPWTGPYINASNVNLPGNANITRNRTQNVPGSMPPGTYLYAARIGDYPNDVWYQSNFNFVMSGTGAGAWMGNDNNYGESFETENSQTALPSDYAITEAYPNPFNPTTAISYQLPTSSFVNLSVYDVAGNKVAELVNGMRDAGSHSVTFDGSKLASGIYLYKLMAGEFTTTQKMVLMK